MVTVCVSQAKIKKEDAKKVEVHVAENVDAPSPRCNCSVSLRIFRVPNRILKKKHNVQKSLPVKRRGAQNCSFLLVL